MTVALKICGAAGTVTGSSYLISHPRGRLLIDCGMFQGPKTLRELNYGRFPFEPAKIDAVLLTHAHIDHSGLLPKLCINGYGGKIMATAETNALLEWMLPDSGAIQESEVRRLNERNLRRGRPAVEPIYSREQAEASLQQLAAVPRNTWIEVAEGVRARYHDAGHILGATSIELEIATGDAKQRLLRLLFSGDIGPDAKAFYDGPQGTENFDYVVLESTYGDRERPKISEERRREALRTEVAAALKAGGNLLIPAFAVERTQELLSDLICLMAQGKLPKSQVFLDSPLAVHATEVFERYRDQLRLAADIAEPFRAPNVRFIESASDSMALGRITGGAIIMAGSGMCDAGRIRQHLENNLWRADATVLLAGYQAPGTLGSLLERGAAKVRIHGQEVSVAARIRKLDVYSGHADRKGLLAWMQARLPVRRGVFLTHGEEAALKSLKEGLTDLDIDAARIVIPRLDQTYILAPTARPRAVASTETPRLSAPAAAAIVEGRDWHNDYASFALDLQDRLRGVADDRERRALLRRLRRAIEPD